MTVQIKSTSATITLTSPLGGKTVLTTGRNAQVIVTSEGRRGVAGADGAAGPMGPPGSGGSVDWGAVQGVLSNQADLVAALAGKETAGAAAAVNAALSAIINTKANQQIYFGAVRPAVPGPWQWFKTDGGVNVLDYIINDGGP
jgi:hypothetical protein